MSDDGYFCKSCGKKQLDERFECVDCKNFICNACILRCDECDNEVCKTCVHTCGYCGINMCKECHDLELHECDGEYDNFRELLVENEESVECPFCKCKTATIYNYNNLDSNMLEKFSEHLWDINEENFNNTEFCEHVVYYRDLTVNGSVNEQYLDKAIIEKIFTQYEKTTSNQQSKFHWGDDLDDPDLILSAKKSGYELASDTVTMYVNGNILGHEFLFAKNID